MMKWLQNGIFKILHQNSLHFPPVQVLACQHTKKPAYVQDTLPWLDSGFSPPSEPQRATINRRFHFRLNHTSLADQTEQRAGNCSGGRGCGNHTDGTAVVMLRP